MRIDVGGVVRLERWAGKHKDVSRRLSLFDIYKKLYMQAAKYRECGRRLAIERYEVYGTDSRRTAASLRVGEHELRQEGRMTSLKNLPYLPRS